MSSVGGCRRRLLWCLCVIALRFGGSEAWRPLRTQQAQHGTSNGGLGNSSRVSNVTGTYRGTWETQGPDPEISIPGLQKGSGVVVFQLKTSGSHKEGVHDVEGDLVLRAGTYLNSKDARFSLRGVYVVDSASLHALAEPEEPLSAALRPAERQQHTPDYRVALREAAKAWAFTEWQGTPGLTQRSTLAATAGSRKTCKFMIDLAAASPSPDGSAVLAGAGADGDDAAQRAAMAFGEGGPGGAPVTFSSGSTGGRMDTLDPSQILMNGTLTSRNCGLSVRVSASSVQVEKYYGKAVNYTLMMTAVSFFQILLLIRQMEATSTQALAAKVSAITIGQQAIIDAYMCLAHLTAGIMVEPLFNNFATVAFFEFIVFAIFEMRFLLTVWRARRSNNADLWQVQREMSALYARFYGALLFGVLMATWLHRYTTLLVFALYSFWIPQIVLCVVTDARQGLKPAYVAGMSALRLALPLYVWACPRNLLKVPPSYGTAAGLVAFVGFQAGLLLLQGYYGPRCFVPKFLLPPRYDYYRALTSKEVAGGSSSPPAPRAATPAPVPVDTNDGADEKQEQPGVTDGDEETGHGSVECVICMNPVDVTRAKARMVAPCGHCFHPPCLQRWMEVKMECPTCRRPLPQP